MQVVVGRQVSLVPGLWVERWGVFPGELILSSKAAIPLSFPGAERSTRPPRSRIGFWVQWLLLLMSGCNCESYLQVNRRLCRYA